MTINFNLKQTPAGDYQIYANIRGRKDLGLTKTKPLYTGKKINSKGLWDFKRQRVKSTQGPDINSLLNEWEKRFSDYKNACIINNRKPILTELLRLFNIEGKQIDINSLANAFDLWMEGKHISHSELTLAKYRSMRGIIEEFEKSMGFQVSLNNVNRAFYNVFTDWLITHKNNRNKTIHRKLKYIKTVMEFANEADLTTNTKWRIKLTDLGDTESIRAPLTKEEILAFLNYTTTDMVAAKRLDAFITACFTGLRYSDIIQLKEVHIHGSEGCRFIDLTGQKTLSDGSVPLPDFIYNRIKKYFAGKSPLFPFHRDSVLVNKAIKKIARELNLDRTLEEVIMKGKKRETKYHHFCDIVSIHWARYTYPNIQEKLNIQPTYIQDNLQHSDFATTNIYRTSDAMDRIQLTATKINEEWGSVGLG